MKSKPGRPVLRVPRQQFLDCVNGKLLENRRGIVICLGDAATDPLTRYMKGEVDIVLTVRGSDFSHIRRDRGGHTEVRFQKRKRKCRTH